MFKTLITGAMATTVAGTAILMAAPQASAFPFTYSNNTLTTIPDATVGNGTASNPQTPGVVSRDIVIGDSGKIIDLTVTITNLVHTRSGDLIARLTHVETNTTVDLFNRIARITPSGPGSVANFNGTYSFSNTGTDIWSVAAGQSQSFIIASGTYAASTSKTTTPNNVAPPSSLLPFTGQNLAGTWRLTLSDNASVNKMPGRFSGWSLSGNAAVPVPPQVLGTALLAGWATVKKLRKQQEAVV
jgi:subtilisin-like proprotein convertase family protein